MRRVQEDQQDRSWAKVVSSFATTERCQVFLFTILLIAILALCSFLVVRTEEIWRDVDNLVKDVDPVYAGEEARQRHDQSKPTPLGALFRPTNVEPLQG